MKYITLKQQVIITLCLILATVFVLLFFIIIPLVSSVKDIKHDTQKQFTKTQNDFKKNKGMFRKTLHETKNALSFTGSLSQITLEKDKQLALITEIESLGKRLHIDHELKVTTKEIDKELFTALPKLKKTGIKEYHIFSFKNKGNTQDHLAYIAALEQLPYYIIIDKLTFNKIKKKHGVQEENAPKVTLTFDAKVFIPPEKKQ